MTNNDGSWSWLWTSKTICGGILALQTISPSIPSMKLWPFTATYSAVKWIACQCHYDTKSLKCNLSKEQKRRVVRIAETTRGFQFPGWVRRRHWIEPPSRCRNKNHHHSAPHPGNESTINDKTQTEIFITNPSVDINTEIHVNAQVP